MNATRNPIKRPSRDDMDDVVYAVQRLTRRFRTHDLKDPIYFGALEQLANRFTDKGMTSKTAGSLVLVYGEIVEEYGLTHEDREAFSVVVFGYMGRNPDAVRAQYDSYL